MDRVLKYNLNLNRYEEPSNLDIQVEEDEPKVEENLETKNEDVIEPRSEDVIEPKVEVIEPNVEDVKVDVQTEEVKESEKRDDL